MTDTVPLPPTPTPVQSCAEAYEAWGEGRLGFGHLVDGAIVLHDGTRCPVSESPHRVPVEVTIPTGQPIVRAPGELAWTAGATWVWPAIGVGCALLVVGILVLVWLERRETRMRHHWLGEDDLEPNGGDGVDLVAAVTGLGETTEPDEDAQQRADTIDPDAWDDLRGDRDRDPQAPHPWRPA